MAIVLHGSALYKACLRRSGQRQARAFAVLPCRRRYDQVNDAIVTRLRSPIRNHGPLGRPWLTYSCCYVDSTFRMVILRGGRDRCYENRRDRFSFYELVNPRDHQVLAREPACRFGRRFAREALKP